MIGLRMTKLKKVDIEKLNEYVASDLIRTQTHPTLPLMILNYSEKAQHKKAWDLYTLSCRGLVIDLFGNIIARPFNKFFNLEEHQVLPDLPYKVYEKVDGSLGILFNFRGEWIMATRGSFTSDQAIEGMKMLNNMKAQQYLVPEYTYLFEIIYPENRIVVDYGANRKLVLIGVINTATGEEITLNCASHIFSAVSEWDVRNPEELKELKLDNFEGFVLKYENNFRIKIKLEEYKRLHKIVTGVSSRSIWDALRFRSPIEGLLEKVPDEFYQWVIDTKQELEVLYETIYEKALVEYQQVPKNCSRKEQAEYIQKYMSYPHIAFKMLDNKPVEEAIWKMLEPKYEQPFKQRVNKEVEEPSKIVG